MIIFKQIEIKNFLSVGNQPVTIDLNTHQSTLIYGTNGSGKTTLLDALTYVLYNKPLRNINLPQLVNTQNKKGLEITVSFSIKSDDYVVVRGMKPKIFDIYVNDELIDAQANDLDNQDILEKTILKLGYKSFTQIVILGTASFIPFMKLPAAQRKDCVEDFLDLKVFSIMSMMAKERLKEYGLELRTFKTDEVRLEQNIKSQEERIDRHKENASVEVETIRKTIETYKLELDEVTNNYHLFNTLRLMEDDSLKKKEKIFSSEKLRELENISLKMSSKIITSQNLVSYIKQHDSCEICNQSISEEIKKSTIETEEDKIIQLDDGLKSIRLVIKRQEACRDKIEVHRKKNEEYKRKISIEELEMDKFKYKIEAEEQRIANLEKNSNDTQIELDILEKLIDELSDVVDKIDKLENTYYDYEVVVNSLKESGIKGQIVKQYIPVMNKLLSKFLTKLDLPIHFKLDEQFNETIESPLHQDFTYSSFSEGQRSRIDLAMMLTWREISKLKNSTSTNLLVLDEVFSSSLDESGKYYLLNILRYDLEHTNIFVVDHTLDDTFKEKFDMSIQVSLLNGFSNYSKKQ